MHFAHRTHCTSVNQLHDTPVIIAGVQLRAHLCGGFALGSGGSNHASFPDVVRQRLFAIHMLIELQSRQGCERVSVFASADNNRVKPVCLVVHFAEIGEFRGLGMLLGGGSDVRLVYVAERDNVFRCYFAHVCTATTAATDDGDVQPFVQIPTVHDCRRGKRRSGGSSRGFQEAATVENVVCTFMARHTGFPAS
jgi:hypothetical protein